MVLEVFLEVFMGGIGSVLEWYWKCSCVVLEVFLSGIGSVHGWYWKCS